MKWEYLDVTLKSYRKNEKSAYAAGMVGKFEDTAQYELISIEEQLNEYGQEGWELTGITSDGPYMRCIFKRPKGENIFKEE